MGGRHPERNVTYFRNKRMKKTSSRQRRIEASSDGVQSPEGAVVPQMDGHVLDRISQTSGTYKIKQQVHCSHV
jgi:hypothetical protein